MTDAALGGAFEPPDLRPSWLRPAAIALALALHAAALATLPYLRSRPAEPPPEVIVNIEQEAAPAAPSAAPPPAPAADEPTKPAAAAPLPEAAPPVPPTPAIEASPPATEETPPPATPAPPSPPEPLAPVEAAPPKPPPPARAEPKLEAKPAPKPQPKPEQARPKVRANEPKPPAAREDRPAAVPAPSATETRPGASAASSATAASKSVYASQIVAAIQSRLFYPPAARVRGAKGVVGVAFTIGASGGLTSFAITHTSGDEDLDRAARTLVESTRFPPPPGGPLHFATSFNYVPR